MKKIFKISVFALVLSGIFASCSKSKITASFPYSGGSSYQYFKRKNAVEPKQKTIQEVARSQQEQEEIALTNKENQNKTLTSAVASNEAEKQFPDIDEKEVKSMIKERVKSMSREEKKELSSLIKEYKKSQRLNEINGLNNTQSTDADGDFIILLILCFLLPPLAVYLIDGDFTDHFWISIILTICFWLPGIIFALWKLLS